MNKITSEKKSKKYFSPMYLGASVSAIGFAVILFSNLIIPNFWKLLNNKTTGTLIIDLLLPVIIFLVLSICIICIIGIFKKIKNHKEEGLILGLTMGFKISLFLGVVIGIAAGFAGVGFALGFAKGFLIGFIIGLLVAISTEFQN